MFGFITGTGMDSIFAKDGIERWHSVVATGRTAEKVTP